MKILEMKDVSYGYDSKTPLLQHINLTLHQGETFSLMGLNGAGKTTLLKIMATLTQPDAGCCHYFANPEMSLVEVRKQLGYVSQEIALYHQDTIEGNLRFFAQLYQMPRQKSRDEINRLLTWLQLDRHRGMKVKHCSGGMKRKVHLAAALLHGPRLLLLDEPTAGIDKPTAMQMMAALRDLAAAGTVVVCVAHSMEEVLALGGRAVWLKNGGIQQSIQLTGNSALDETQLKHMMAAGF